MNVAVAPIVADALEALGSANRDHVGTTQGTVLTKS